MFQLGGYGSTHLLGQLKHLQTGWGVLVELGHVQRSDLVHADLVQTQVSLENTPDKIAESGGAHRFPLPGKEQVPVSIFGQGDRQHPLNEFLYSSAKWLRSVHGNSWF